MLLGNGIRIARNVTKLRDGRTMVLVMSIWNEPRHLIKGMTVALVKDLSDVTRGLVVTEASCDPSPEKLAPSELDVDPRLSSQQRKGLLELLNEFHNCFTALSRARRMTITKHRIIPDDDAHPACQLPYQISLKVTETI